MSQDAQSPQHWQLPFQQGSIAVNYYATNEQLIQIQNDNSAVLSQQPGQERDLGQSFTDPDGLFGTSRASIQPSIPDATCGGRSMALGYDDPLSQSLNCTSRPILDPFLSGGSLHVGNGQWPFIKAPDEVADAPMSGPVTESSLHSPIAPSASGPVVIKLAAAENDIRPVGTPQIQQASSSRRKKDGIYQCPFRNTGCTRTFTATHNVKYHCNSHLNLKPYECSKCPYAAASPGTLARHVNKLHQ